MAITQILLPGSTTPIDINDARISIETSTIGSVTQPVYLNSGAITPINYTIAKSVPSDAIFTDNNLTIAVKGTIFTANALVNITSGSNVTLSTSGSTVTISATDTKYTAGSGITISGSTIAVQYNTADLAIGTDGLEVSGNIKSQISSKLDTLIAGSNILINGSTISATDTTYTAGKNISISGTTINSNITMQSGATAFYIMGSTSQPSSPIAIDTLHGSSSVLYDTIHGLTSPKVQVGSTSNGCRMEYDSTNKKLTFVFS